MKKLLYVLLFFPSITFGMLPSEIFPWAFIVSLIYMRLCWKEILLLIILFLPSFIIGYYAGAHNMEMLRSLMAFLNAMLIYFVVVRLNDDNFALLYDSLKISILLSIMVGVCQFIIPDNIGDTVIHFLTPRASSGFSETGLSGRGVSGLATEPGRQAIEIILMYATVNAIDKRFLIIDYVDDVLIVIYILIMNRSFTGLSLLLVFFVARFIVSNKKYVLAISSIVVISILFVPGELYVGARGGSIVNEIYQNGWDKVISIIMEYSGFRVPSVINAYLDMSLFGYGLGNWGESTVRGMNLYPYLYNVPYFNYAGFDGVRSFSFIAGLLVEGGVFVTVVFVIMVAREYMKNIRKGISKNMLYVMPVIVSVFFLGNIGSPIQFICLGMFASHHGFNRLR